MERADEPGGATPRGHLVIIGGSERLDRTLRLLWRFLHLCDSAPGRRDIVIITSATSARWVGRATRFTCRRSPRAKKRQTRASPL